MTDHSDHSSAVPGRAPAENVDLPELRNLAVLAKSAARNQFGLSPWFRHGGLVDGETAVVVPPDVVVALLDRIDALEAGLLHVANGAQCTNYTGDHWCRRPGSGRTRDARYGADRWCDTCIALDALGERSHAE